MNQDGPPRDHAYSDVDSDEPRPLEQNLKSKSTWLRILFMIAVTILYAVSRIILGVVVVFQVLYVLITGSPNKPLITLGKSLATYTYQIVLYLTFNSDVRPFPFDADWPYETADESQENDTGANMD